MYVYSVQLSMGLGVNFLSGDENHQVFLLMSNMNDSAIHTHASASFQKQLGEMSLGENGSRYLEM